MAKRYISVEKEAPFQNRTEQWSNVYCYEMGNVTLADHQALEDAVLAAERACHGTMVKFIRTRTFTTDDLALGDNGTMYNITERNAMGTNGSTNLAYRECAILVKWPLPRKVKLGGGLGRQRSLKKWLHSCSFPSLGTDMLNGTAALDSTAKTPFNTYATAIAAPNANSQLISASDGATPSGAAIIHPYMEHRQFPRGRKEGAL